MVRCLMVAVCCTAGSPWRSELATAAGKTTAAAAQPLPRSRLPESAQQSAQRPPPLCSSPNSHRRSHCICVARVSRLLLYELYLRTKYDAQCAISVYLCLLKCNYTRKSDALCVMEYNKYHYTYKV